MNMFCAIMAMYRVTNCIVGTALVTASIGVHQGSPTSCLLFVLYVNDLIRMIKQNCGWAGYMCLPSWTIPFCCQPLDIL